MNGYDGCGIAQLDALWGTCRLLLVSQAQFKSVEPSFSGIVKCIDDADSLRVSLVQLEGQRFENIGVTCPEITSLLGSDRDAADKVRRLCAERTYLAYRSLNPCATQLRCLLHSVGFYEIAEIEANELLTIDSSSVSGLPDGRFELQSTRPAALDAVLARVLVASRYALPSNTQRRWTLFGNPLRMRPDLGVTSSNDAEIGLATREVASDSAVEGTTLTVTANISWERAGASGAFAGIVGSYSGPGDSNMYVAMLDAYASPFAQISIWRCDNNWVRVAHTHFRLDLDKTAQSLALTLAIDPTSVEVRIDANSVLWAYDSGIARTDCYGIRMRGDQFSVGQIAATQGNP